MFLTLKHRRGLVTFLWAFLIAGAFIVGGIPKPPEANALTTVLEIRRLTPERSQIRFCVDWQDPIYHKRHETCTWWIGQPDPTSETPSSTDK